jgi:hypothetical protein
VLCEGSFWGSLGSWFFRIITSSHLVSSMGCLVVSSSSSSWMTTEHCEEVEGAYYWDSTLVVPVIVLVSGSLHFDIVAVVVVE